MSAEEIEDDGRCTKCVIEDAEAWEIIDSATASELSAVRSIMQGTDND